MDVVGRIRFLFTAFVTVAILWNGASAQDVALPTRPRANEVIEAGITYNIEWTVLNKAARMIVYLVDASLAPLNRRLEDISSEYVKHHIMHGAFPRAGSSCWWLLLEVLTYAVPSSSSSYSVSVADGSLEWPIDGGRTWNSSAPYVVCLMSRSQENRTNVCTDKFSIRNKASGQPGPASNATQTQGGSSPSGGANSLGGLSTPAMAGIVAVAVLSASIGIVVAVLYMRRRRWPLSVAPSDRGDGDQEDGAAGRTPASGRNTISSLSKPELEGTKGYCSSPGAEAGALALKPELMEKEQPQELGRADNNRNLPSEHEIYEMGDCELAETADPATTEDTPSVEPAGINSAAPTTRGEESRGSQRHATKPSGTSQEEVERQTRIREIQEVSRRLKEELEKLSPGGLGSQPGS